VVGIIAFVSGLSSSVRLPYSQPAMPMSRNSSAGAISGWLSLVPLVWMISCSGSPALALLRVLARQRATVKVVQLEHPAVGEVRVVRNRQQLAPVFFS